ncbi:MAG: MFS transporter [Treponema sp. GWB1_62_6]|nr:MAG: MFS transporter [Treponema sp. GWC1_61_84]OHE69977.1 MAG: MFS transporter [Treponema sp. GWB1_62_6]HCM25801.1 MFS transporter [Treponema sp.]
MATSLLVLIYIAFISLGLPDALLGAGWPVMQPELGVPYGFAGLVSMTISGGTILSAVFSSRVLKKHGTGRVTAFSVTLTAMALFSFAATPSFWWLLVAAVPLGLGGGAVDSGLNAYVAEHYESRHMSWLHSSWGVGALTGPLALSAMLAQGTTWRKGYLAIAIFQVALVLALIAAVPLWDKVRARIRADRPPADVPHQPLFFPLKIRGVKLALAAFFFYCGIESTMGLWGGSFLFKTKGLGAASVATWVSLFYASITVGRFLTGFVTYRVPNKVLIRWGGMVILAGVVLMLVPFALPFTLTGFLLVGFGCAPLFPCMLHETPNRFGAGHSQAVMGFQMAVAYMGATFLPPLFGFIASATTLALLPVFLAGYIVLLILSSELLRKKLGHS